MMVQMAFWLGLVTRRAKDLVLLPFKGVQHKLRSRKSGQERPEAASPVRNKIISRLARINSHLQSLEQTALLSRRLSDYQHSEFRPGDVSEKLIEALTDPDASVRKLVLGSLGECRTEHAALLVVDALQDDDPGVRCAAAATASKMNSQASVFSLILLLDDSSMEVRQEAKKAIEAITGRRVEFDPSQRGSTQKEKIESLKNWWKQERFSNLAKEVEAVIES